MTQAASPPSILRLRPLGFPWETRDPFLFCVHHDDHYPKGDERMAPAVSLSGRDLGQDFVVKDGFRMYHGLTVPGFPQHPHRGFETVTVVRRGLIDHFDSAGAAARYGEGDVQWLTAGGGVSHSEMFPLTRADQDNPLELFQIWVNLAAADKRAEPHFSMFWRDAIPTHRAVDDQGRETEVRVIAGRLGEVTGPPPPPRSWASRAPEGFAIWTLRLSKGARFTLPATGPDVLRTLYFYRGAALTVDGQVVPAAHSIEIGPGAVTLEAGEEGAELLLLGGRPIGEPVVSYGPFVMNTRAEIAQAFADYQRTRFGGWPWPKDDPVHPRAEGRFARHADGRIDRPPLA